MAIAFVLPASAANYTDLGGHWAESYMKDLAEKGYLSGYPDNTMRPNENMKAIETLVMLSRFYTVGDTELAMIKADYMATVTSAVPATLAWAYDSLTVCLAAGIITPSELKTINLQAEIRKEQLAVFLVRAMQLTAAAEALAGTTLPFADANLISPSCFTSVAELYAIKIVSGDNLNKFNPQASARRCDVAAMVSRALDLAKSNNKTFLIEGYSGLSRTEGIITSVGTNTVEFKGLDGLTRIYNVPATATVTVNGAAKTMNILYEGCYANIYFKDNAITKIAIESAENIKWVQGVVYSSLTDYIAVKNPVTGAVTSYPIDSTNTITKDGVSVAASAVKTSDLVTLKLQNNFCVKIIATFGDRELIGTITEISYGTTVSMKVTDSAGVSYRFLLDIANLPQIMRGSIAIGVDRLKTGTAVTMKIDDGALAAIILSGTENTVEGELTAVSTTKTGTVWTLTKADGTAVTLKVDENAAAYSGTKSILLTDINVGDTVTVVVYGDTITEIHLKSSVATSKKVTGAVLAVDAQKKTLTLLTSAEKLIYIDASSVVTIIYAGTGRTMNLGNITVNSQLVVYGTYSDASNFKATAIIVE